MGDIASLLKKTPFSYLGMAFTVAWAYVVFYTATLWPLTSVEPQAANLYRAANLCASILGLFLLVILHRRFGELSLRPRVQVVASLLASASTLIAAFLPPGEPVFMGAALAACCLASLCSTPLYIAWGHFYAHPFNRAPRKLLPVALALAMALSLICLLVTGIGLAVFAAALPLLSAGFLRKAMHDSSAVADGYTAAAKATVSLSDYRSSAMETFEMACSEITRTYGLSAREEEVLVLVGRGRDLPYICKQLYISKPTVNTHIRHIYEKMGIHSKQELIDLLEEYDMDIEVGVDAGGGTV